MKCNRLGKGVFGLVWLPLLLSWCTQEPTRSEGNLSDGLAAVDELLLDEEWEEAELLLLELTKASAGTADGVLRRHELSRRLEQALFWPIAMVPTDRELLPAKVKTYSKGSGGLRLMYDAEQLIAERVRINKKVRDDQKELKAVEALRGGDRALHHLQLPFAELRELRFEVQNEHIVTFFDQAIFSVSLGVETDEPLLISPGLAEKDTHMTNTWYPPQVKDKSGELLVKGELTPKKPLEGYELRLVVKGEKLEVYIDGKRALKCKHSTEIGCDLTTWRADWIQSLEAKGKVDKSWLRLARDENLYGQRQTIGIQERAQALLEQQAPLALIPRGDFPEIDFPDGPPCTDDYKVRVRVLRQAIYNHEAERFRELRSAIPSEGNDPLLWKLLSAHEALASNRGGDARNYLKPVLDAYPNSLEALCLQASSYRISGKWSLALRAFEDLLEVEAVRHWVYAYLPEVDLWTTGPEAAWIRLREAWDNQCFGLENDQLCRRLTFVSEGPAWPEPSLYSSEHFDVVSNINKRTSNEASHVLEVGLRYFTERLLPVDLGKERFQVYLFGGRSGFNEFYGEISDGTAENAAGVYTGLFKQLLIWELPDREEFMRTVRHEGFHQYFDALLEDSPVWLNEGLAEYFEAADFTKSKSNQIPVREEYLEVLAVPFSLSEWQDFIRIEHGQFYTQDDSYARAWGLVYFLLHSTPGNRELFDRILLALHEGSEASEQIVKSELRPGMGALGRQMEAFYKELFDSKD